MFNERDPLPQGNFTPTSSRYLNPFLAFSIVFYLQELEKKKLGFFLLIALQPRVNEG